MSESKAQKQAKNNSGSVGAEPIVIFTSHFNDNLFFGEKPNLSSDKMTIDCLQCQHVWHDFEKGYYCDLPNEQCDFEEI